MIFYQHMQGAQQPNTLTLDEVFAWNVRFQVLVENQEEHDLLSAYQLMFGREIQIDVFSEWLRKHGPQEVEIGGNIYFHAGDSLLPVTFTTFVYDLREFT